MKDSIIRKLSVLRGERFYGGHRALSLATMSFGPTHVVQGHRGPRELHRFALHIDCPWRLRRGETLLVGSQDRYAAARGLDPDDPAVDVDSPGATRWDERMGEFRTEAERTEYVVEGVDADEVGGLAIRMRGPLLLEVFPAGTDRERPCEHWRFFETGSEARHFVVTAAGLNPE